MTDTPKEPQRDDLDDVIFEDPLDDDDDLDEDCGMGPDGQCSYAGSEWCDWDCPMERAKWRKKKP